MRAYVFSSADHSPPPPLPSHALCPLFLTCPLRYFGRLAVVTPQEHEAVEVARIRRETVFHAQPFHQTKPFVVMRSSAALTVPQSPLLMTKLRQSARSPFGHYSQLGNPTPASPRSAMRQSMKSPRGLAAMARGTPTVSPRGPLHIPRSMPR